MNRMLQTNEAERDCFLFIDRFWCIRRKEILGFTSEVFYDRVHTNQLQNM